MSIFSRVQRPSPSMIVALVALSVALGGTGYAAIKLPSNSVGTKQLKRNAVTGSKVRDHSLLVKDFASGQIPKGPAGSPGQAGVQGAKGDQGVAGSALAFAHVNSDGTLDAARSKNVDATSKSPALGYYCIHTTVTVKHAVATLDFDNGEVSVGFSDSFTSCPANTTAVVRTFTSAGSDATSKAFFILFN